MLDGMFTPAAYYKHERARISRALHTSQHRPKCVLHTPNLAVCVAVFLVFLVHFIQYIRLKTTFICAYCKNLKFRLTLEKCFDHNILWILGQNWAISPSFTQHLGSKKVLAFGSNLCYHTVEQSSTARNTNRSTAQLTPRRAPRRVYLANFIAQLKPAGGR